MLALLGADAVDRRSSRRALLRGRRAVGAVDERRAALEPLDSARPRACRCSGGIATTCGHPRSRSGSRSRPSCSSGRCSCGWSSPGDCGPPLAAVVIGLAVTTAAWAVIGFDGLDRLPGPPAAVSRRSRPRGATRSSAWRRRSDSAKASDRLLTLAVGGALLVWVRRARATRRRRAVVHLRRRGDARLEPDRLAPLPRCAARPAGDRAAALLRDLAAPRAALDQSQAGYAEGFATFVPGIAAAILVGVLLTRPRVGKPVAAPA